METIHFKTVDPLSQDLLCEAARKGISLNWERYEKQQPQDGFFRLGLACPYGCLQGPCRIDPFGRGAQNGVCGLDRDGMVAASLLRLSLQGVLETMALDPDCCGSEIRWPAPLASRAAASLGQTGDDRPLSFIDVLESVRLLARPSATPGTLVRQAIRIALLATSLRAQIKPEPDKRTVRSGYGLLAGDAVRIAVTGQFCKTTIAVLQQQAAAASPAIQLLSVGGWAAAGDAYLPIVCTSGEAETVLSSGCFDLLLAGEGADPGLLSLAAKLSLPVIAAGEGPQPADILQRARETHSRKVPAAFSPDASLVGEAAVALGGDALLSALKAGASTKVALVGGADTLFLSLGHLPTELANALRGQELAVASWGDAALWMMKQELPVGLLDADEGPLAAVLALAEAEKLPSLAGICFTGFRDNREFTLALGLAALGQKVLVATPLPLWGSEKVRSLVREALAAAGGSLAHFDHPARPDEIMDWYLRA